MHVLLYSTADCQLCDAFHFELLDLEAELGFAYKKRLLTEADRLFAEFRGRFPVGEISAGGETKRLLEVYSQPALRRHLRQVAGGMTAQESD